MARISLPAPARLRQRATDSHLTSARISAPLVPCGLLSRSVRLCWSLFRAVVFGIPIMLFVMCYLTGIAIEDMLSSEKKRQVPSRAYSDD